MAVEIPYSATDFARAFRELLAIARSLRKYVIRPLMDAGERRQTRRAATHIDTLAFRPGAMRDPLARIAAGTGTPADLDLLAAMLSSSADRVGRSIDALRYYRTQVREKFGMKYSFQLDEVIFRKIKIRLSLTELAENQIAISKLQGDAEEIYQLINKLNDELIALHDMILPPANAPKKKKSNATAARKLR